MTCTFTLPIATLAVLMRVHMLPSFVESVPSKFRSIVDDAKANAREFFEILLRASGYNDIEVAFEDE